MLSTKIAAFFCVNIKAKYWGILPDITIQANEKIIWKPKAKVSVPEDNPLL